MDLFSTGVISGGTGLLTWLGTTLVNRNTNRNAAAERKAKEKIEQDDRLEIHRDDLTFELLKTAREEIAGARAEMSTLREEVSTLRALEQHYYHLQQALEHLDAILAASSPEDRVTAERAARAFVNRMRRLNDAKGTIANETQRLDSGMKLSESGFVKLEKTRGPDSEDVS
jgi:N-dimethylarginine dimethylaminohydrolase